MFGNDGLPVSKEHEWDVAMFNMIGGRFVFMLKESGTMKSRWSWDENTQLTLNW